MMAVFVFLGVVIVIIALYYGVNLSARALSSMKSRGRK
jgi:hypothetical protein